MSAETIPQLHTFEEFCATIEDGQKADLINGIIHMASPDTIRNNDLTNFLFVLLDGYARPRRLGSVHTSRVAFRIGRRNGPEPDVAFVSAANQDRVQATHILGGPDIAVEIVSVDSLERDYITKRAVYEAAGVAEYWIIDPARGRVAFLCLDNGEYEEAQTPDGIYRSTVLPGFWIEAQWLLQEPLPDHFECVRRIAAGDPGMREGDNA